MVISKHWRRSRVWAYSRLSSGQCPEALKWFSNGDKNHRTVRTGRQAQTDDSQVTVYCPSSHAAEKNPGSGHLAGFTSRLKAGPWGHRWGRPKETNGSDQRSRPNEGLRNRRNQEWTWGRNCPPVLSLLAFLKLKTEGLAHDSDDASKMENYVSSRSNWPASLRP